MKNCHPMPTIKTYSLNERFGESNKLIILKLPHTDTSKDDTILK